VFDDSVSSKSVTGTGLLNETIHCGASPRLGEMLVRLQVVMFPSTTSSGPWALSDVLSDVPDSIALPYLTVLAG